MDQIFQIIICSCITFQLKSSHLNNDVMFPTLPCLLQQSLGSLPSVSSKKKIFSMWQTATEIKKRLKTHSPQYPPLLLLFVFVAHWLYKVELVMSTQFPTTLISQPATLRGYYLQWKRKHPIPKASRIARSWSRYHAVERGQGWLNTNVPPSQRCHMGEGEGVRTEKQPWTEIGSIWLKLGVAYNCWNSDIDQKKKYLNQNSIEV